LIADHTLPRTAISSARRPGFTRRSAGLAGISAGASALVACGATATTPVAGERPRTLRVGLIPNQAPDRVRAQYQPLGDYLQKTLAQPIELVVATDYTGVVEAMASDKLDVAYFGGLTFAQAEIRADVSPLVTEIDRETNSKQYYSAIITRPDSAIKALADLKDPARKFAFGDINSTSGSLYPRIMLDRAGVSGGGGTTPYTDPQRFINSGGHDATTLAVVNGSVDAGGVEKRVMQRLIDAGTVKADQIRVVEQTLVMGYPWVVRNRLDRALLEQIASAFINLKDAELLKLMRAERYERVVRTEYDEVRREATRLGLLR